jgi:hypothetical protein
LVDVGGTNEVQRGLIAKAFSVFCNRPFLPPDSPAAIRSRPNRSEAALRSISDGTSFANARP